MLKIGSIRWKGKCRTHPLYNPAHAGEGAIKGGCPRCGKLLDIFQQHTRMIQLMREFAPRDPSAARARRQPTTGTQTLLFDTIETPSSLD